MEDDDEFRDSRIRRRGILDIEAGDEEEGTGSPFDIRSTKNFPVRRLRRWRQAALVLNASRRFRYTLDLKKQDAKKEIERKIRTHAQVIRAAYLFKEAGVKAPPKTLSPPISEYGVAIEDLIFMSREHDLSMLQLLGGVAGLSEKLKTDTEKGIQGNDDDIVRRRDVFGSNTYPRKKSRSFWTFLWEAWQDLTLIILMVAAVASLALGMKSEGIQQGWYDGGSITFAVILVILVTVLKPTSFQQWKILTSCVLVILLLAIPSYLLDSLNLLIYELKVDPYVCFSLSFTKTAVSDYKQSLQFQSLNEEKQNIHLEVFRGGRRIEMSIFEIVVGDVIPLKIGDQVPAEGVLLSGQSLAIDESSMTGESRIVQKNPKAPFLMSGCKVADGYGTMLATSVGTNTEWGLLMSSISEDTGEETPLQVRLNGLATFIGAVGLTVAFLVLAVLLIRYFTGHTQNADGIDQFKVGKTSISHAIDGVIKIVTIAVTIVVVAVPEGLPLAVTLTAAAQSRVFLAYSMRKMMKDKALVRRLSACETMGSATTICSDKTGTLTLNQMTVVEAYANGRKINPPTDGSLLSSTLSSLLIEGVALNTTGSVFVPEAGADAEVSGSPTEKAILYWGVKLGMNFTAERSKSSIIHAFPFNSEKKRGGVAVKTADLKVRIHWKGAAEIVLASCTHYIDETDSVVSLDEPKLRSFKKSIEDMAAGSLRCIAIAYRLHELEKVPIDDGELLRWEIPGDELILLAIVGIKDPCRPGVKEAVQLCTKAGVKVRMVTGDNLQTAKAIALECGILASDADASEPNLIEGKRFRALSEDQRQEIAGKISVMGRSSPNDKLLLVKALKKSHVVAVTGDGTNDAPALHEADIGLSMGIQGTEVAKESSDIIILDDDLTSVVKLPDLWSDDAMFEFTHLYFVRLLLFDFSFVSSTDGVSDLCGEWFVEVVEYFMSLTNCLCDRRKPVVRYSPGAYSAFHALSVIGGKRSSVKKAGSMDDADKWELVMNEEMQSLEKNNTWSFVRKSVVALTSTEAKFMAWTHANKEVVWLEDLSSELGIQGQIGCQHGLCALDTTVPDGFGMSLEHGQVVKWGRSVYANIQKFIQFQLTVNVAALTINVVAAFSTGNVPLNAVQLLWVNLIMDTLGALALATEPPTDYLMHRPPVGRREPLITNIMWRNVLIQAAYQVTVLLVLHFRGLTLLHLQHEGREQANKIKNTVVFNAFVFCQLFNEFNARKPDQFNVFEGVLKNRLFMGIVGVTLILQASSLILVLIIEFLGKFTTTVRLNWKLWIVCFAIGFISWPLAVIGKLIPVPQTPLSNFFKFEFPWRQRREGQQREDEDILGQ
ncbi:Calcium-transporting ATPase 10, plasma membrane-type-like protein [Drosera capensis]